MNNYRYQVINQHGEVKSQHQTYEAAEKALYRAKQWRCGVCGSSKRGWGQCSHGTQHLVCNADRYNWRIIQIG